MHVEPRFNLKLEQIKRIMLDLALTLKIHPIALGVKGEPSGQVFVPDGVFVHATRIVNIFDYNNRDRSASIKNASFARLEKLTGLNSIPDPGSELRLVIQPKQQLDAVIVVEHRNLDEIVVREDLAVKNVIFVMTAGFPDSATKEFLHMLSQEKQCGKLPFLYFGDHEPYASRYSNVLNTARLLLHGYRRFPSALN